MPIPLPPPFRRLAWSNLAAQAGEQIGLAAAPLIAVLALGAGVGQTGLLAAAQSLPFLLLSLPAGLLADRLPRRRLMIAAELVRAAALLAILVLLLGDLLTLPLLALAGALSTTGTVVFSVTAPALVPTLVERTQFARANTRLELARSLAFAAGPALAGAIVAAAGGSAAFAFAAALLLATLPEAPPAARPRRHPLAELADGWRFVAGHPLLRPIMATAIAWNLSWFILQAAFVPFAVEILGLGSRAIGLTLAAYGIGMVAGAAIAPWFGRHLRFGLMIAIGPATSVLAAAAMAASTLATPLLPAPLLPGPLLPGPLLPALAMFLFGVGPILWTIGQTTLRQAVTPPAMLGRASALFMTASSGARPIGAALGGLVGTAYGVRAAILLAAAGFVVQLILILVSPVPRLKEMPA